LILYVGGAIFEGRDSYIILHDRKHDLKAKWYIVLTPATPKNPYAFLAQICYIEVPSGGFSPMTS
jgi:hypothetical protein